MGHIGITHYTCCVRTSPNAPRPITFRISKSSLCRRICFTLEVKGLAVERQVLIIISLKSRKTSVTNAPNTKRIRTSCRMNWNETEVNKLQLQLSNVLFSRADIHSEATTLRTLLQFYLWFKSANQTAALQCIKPCSYSSAYKCCL